MTPKILRGKRPKSPNFEVFMNKNRALLRRLSKYRSRLRRGRIGERKLTQADRSAIEERNEGIKWSLYLSAREHGLTVSKKGVIDPLLQRWSPERSVVAQLLWKTRKADARSAKGGRYVVGKTTKAGVTVGVGPHRFKGRSFSFNRIFSHTNAGKHFLQALLRNGGEVLDVGAGAGEYWQRVKQKAQRIGSRVHVTALNPSRFLTSKAIDELRVGAIETANLGRKHYPFILCSYGGFEKSKFPLQVLQKMCGRLKKGGLCYILLGRQVLGTNVRGNLINIGGSRRPSEVKRVRKIFQQALGSDFKIVEYLPSGSFRKDLLIERVR